MRLKTINILAIMAFVLSLTGCGKPKYVSDEVAPGGWVNFAITLTGEVIEHPDTRPQTATPMPIKPLWHAIIDANDDDDHHDFYKVQSISIYHT